MNWCYVGATERGEINIAYTNLMRMAEALEISLSELVSEAEGSDSA